MGENTRRILVGGVEKKPNFVRAAAKTIERAATVAVLATGLALMPYNAVADNTKKDKGAQQEKQKTLNTKELKKKTEGPEKVSKDKRGFYVEAAKKNPVEMKKGNAKVSVIGVVSKVDGFLNYVMVDLKGPDSGTIKDPSSISGDDPVPAGDQKWIIDLGDLENELGEDLKAVHIFTKYIKSGQKVPNLFTGPEEETINMYGEEHDGATDNDLDSFPGERVIEFGVSNPYGGSKKDKIKSNGEILRVYIIPGTEKDVEKGNIDGDMPVMVLKLAKNLDTGKYEMAKNMEYVTEAPIPAVDLFSL